MPGEYSIRFTGLYSLHHRIENGSAGFFRRLFFLQFIKNCEFFSFGKFAQFMDLRVNGEDLLVFHIGGFTDI